jgi:23S rRNA U2552 (ribose-2'-O)-methylase RlmE/FtsJ
MPTVLTTIASRHICVTGLSAETTLDTVCLALGKFGDVLSVRGISNQKAEVGSCGVAFVEFADLLAAKSVVSASVVVNEVSCPCHFVFSPDDEQLPQLAPGQQNLLVVAFYNVYMQRCCEYLNEHEHVSGIISTQTGQQEGVVIAKLVDGPIEQLVGEICSRPGFLFYLKAIYPCTHVSSKESYDYSQFVGGGQILRLHLSCVEKMQQIQSFEDAGVTLDPKAYSTVAVMVEAETDSGETVVLHSRLSKTCFDKYLNPGTLRNFSSTQYGKDITRAHHKLREVEACYELLNSRRARRRNSGGGKKVGERPVVLDVGSAPGGWTFFLAEEGCTVVSVDPGKLHPDATQLEAVTHLQMKVEDAATKGLLQKHGECSTCTSLVCSTCPSLVCSTCPSVAPYSPSVAPYAMQYALVCALSHYTLSLSLSLVYCLLRCIRHAGPFELVVCDMNIDSRDAARIMVALLPYCTPDADLVLTLKLSRRLGAFGLMDLRRQCSEILCPGFNELGTTWLFSNSPNERTLVATRRGYSEMKKSEATNNSRVGTSTETWQLPFAALAVAATIVVVAIVVARRRQTS